MKGRLHPFSNGSKYDWSKLRSLFDFFFPYAKNGNYEYIRCEATTHVSLVNDTKIITRDFYTFRAFAWHYIYELLINPLKKLQFQLLQLNNIRYELLVLLAIQNPKFIPLLALPIAFDTASSATATGTSLTYSHTTSGNNRIILTSSGIGSSTETVTGVTYATVTETQVQLVTETNQITRLYLHNLVNPTIGANNVVVSTSASTGIRSVSSSYTGAAQSGQPDNSGTDSPGSVTSMTVSLTPVVDNCWMISAAHNDQQTVSAGTGSTSRGSVSTINMGDNNAAISPPASTSMTWTIPLARYMTGVKASIAPAANIRGYKTLLGVGQV